MAATFLAAICLMTAPVEAAEPESESVPVPIIMYHSLNAKGGDIWTLSPAAFEEDLRYLSDNGYTAVFLSELIEYVDNGTPLPDKPVVLSFDDGYYNNYTQALPLLEKYDAKMTLSVIGEHAELFSVEKDQNEDYGHLSWEELREFQDTGRMELVNHTWGLHCKKDGRVGCCRVQGEALGQYGGVLTQDVERLQASLLEHCGAVPRSFAYPFGSKSPESNDVLKAMGFRVTLSCYEGINQVSIGNPDCLYDMHRNNRSPDKPVRQFLE